MLIPSYGYRIKAKPYGGENMSSNIDQMIIQKVVIHQVLKRENQHNITPPLYNDTCSELDNESLDALQKRFTKSLGSNSHSMKMEVRNTEAGSVFQYITDFWLSNEDDDKFVQLSKELTKLLAESQTNGRIPGGVVVIVKGIVTEFQKDFIAIIKAEKHDGFNITEEEGRNLLKYFNNLVLSPQQKLQKIGYFVNNAVKGRAIAKKDVDAFVFDSNTSETSMSAHAAYFYDKFLGLGFRTDAEFITNKFYMGTRDFINTCHSLSSENKINLQSDLRNYLEAGNTTVINPNDFIRRTVTDGKIIDEYLTFIDAQNVPLQDTKKYLNLVNKSMKDRRMSFENHIKLSGPSEAFKENIKVEERGEETIITIKGKYINEK